VTQRAALRQRNARPRQWVDHAASPGCGRVRMLIAVVVVVALAAAAWLVFEWLVRWLTQD